MSIPFLGRIPQEPSVVASGDAGVRIAAASPDAPAARAFTSTAQAVLARLAEAGRSAGAFDVVWRRMGPKERHDDRAARRATILPGHARRPVAAWQAADDRLAVLWGDGTKTFHGSYALRQACPCAGCKEGVDRAAHGHAGRGPERRAPRDDPQRGPPCAATGLERRTPLRTLPVSRAAPRCRGGGEFPGGRPMPRTVNCVILKREAEGLDYPPIPGELGRKIYESVSKEGWAMWTSRQTMLINEYRLNLADANAQKL